jgi:hypothetical protein
MSRTPTANARARLSPEVFILLTILAQQATWVSVVPAIQIQAARARSSISAQQREPRTHTNLSYLGICVDAIWLAGISAAVHS